MSISRFEFDLRNTSWWRSISPVTNIKIWKQRHHLLELCFWLVFRFKSNTFLLFLFSLKKSGVFSTFMAVDWRWTLACVTNNMVCWAQLNWETVLDDEFCAALHWNVLKRSRGFTSYNTVTVYLSLQSCSGTLFSPQKHYCCVLWGFSLRFCGFFLFPLYFLSFCSIFCLLASS